MTLTVTCNSDEPLEIGKSAFCANRDIATSKNNPPRVLHGHGHGHGIFTCMGSIHYNAESTSALATFKLEVRDAVLCQISFCAAHNS
jgi:hypothetical protein